MPHPSCVCGVVRREDRTCNTKGCSHYRPSLRGAAVAEYQRKRKPTAEVLDKKRDKEAVDADAWVSCTKRLVAAADVSRGTLLACGFSGAQMDALLSRGNVAELMLPGESRRRSPAPRTSTCSSPKKFRKVVDEIGADPWEHVVALCKKQRAVGAGRAALKG